MCFYARDLVIDVMFSPSFPPSLDVPAGKFLVFEAGIASSMPLGFGPSSSASLEVANHYIAPNPPSHPSLPPSLPPSPRRARG